mgnify:CR=1 FL=1
MKHRWTTLLWELWAAQALCAVAALPPGSAFHTCPALALPGLALAAAGDFSICLYNPSSKKRADYLRRACDILLREKSPDTVCGWVRNIGREGQQHRLLTLARLRDEQVDMFTTVFIGAATTQAVAGRMVTPRGYEAKR